MQTVDSPAALPRSRQRLIRFALVTVLLICSSGASCSRTLRNPFGPYSPPAPEVLATGSSLDQVIAAVNQNAARLQSFQTNNASIKVPGMAGIPLLSGHIAAQRPGRIRLQAKTTITGPEVDLGANDELFWFWMRRNQPRALYFARHDQFAGSSAQQFMPIEPQWLLDALGFAEFKPTDFHEGPLPVGKGKVEIRSVVQSRTGQLTKRTVVDAHRALILEQHVYDVAGTLVASAVARSHFYYEHIGASLPQEVDVSVPGADLNLSIDLGTVEVNTIGASTQLWALPTIPGSPPTDLGAAAASAGGVPRMGDQLTRADWSHAAPLVSGPPIVGAPDVSALPVAPAPQSVSPGGIVAQQPLDPFADAAPAAVQRLPAGGVPQGVFVR